MGKPVIIILLFNIQLTEDETSRLNISMSYLEVKMKRTVYVISGPAGVGKSTTSQWLVHKLERSSFISGDDISHLTVNGRGKPWLCEETLKLTWMNIASLTKNILSFNFDVVIDYVTFPSEIKWLSDELREKDVRIVYVVLMVDANTIRMRDRSRPEEIQMGERSIILLKEFEELIIDTRFLLNTQNYDEKQLDIIINEIMKNEQYVF